ncbi:MAG: alpha-ketoacid dehydrogenase subunit beta [Betaproteobacteria bacterium]|nr:alpha-ketoacid dehydrogenase subunit beta [Betaproteobacteria bacterium]
MNVPTEAARAATAARRLTLGQAIVEGIREEMLRDPNVFLFGQDIGAFGGPLQSTAGLWDEFGPSRIFETPICESAMTGMAVGAAMMGLRPIVEIMFTDILPVAMTELIQQAATVRYMTAGKACAPMVIRTKGGDGPYRSHPQNYEALLAHSPGLIVVMPSTPADGKGMIKSAIRSNDPVVFIENIFLYHGQKDEVPEGDYVVPLGRASIARPGRDVTVVTYGRAVRTALSAAGRLAQEGIELEVLDLRTLVPFDTEAILASVRRTGRLLTVHEAWTRGGLGAEIVAEVTESEFASLKSAPRRIGAPAIPIPYAEPLRDTVIPTVNAIVREVRALMGVPADSDGKAAR